MVFPQLCSNVMNSEGRFHPGDHVLGVPFEHQLCQLGRPRRPPERGLLDPVGDAGRVVEVANVFELFDEPLHPYTRGLFRSIPMLRDVKHRLVTVEDVTNDPAEFRRIPGVIPWWPHSSKESRPAPAPGRDEHVLVEVRPNRWVGCWRTPELDAQVHRRPALEYRRGDR